MSAQNRKTGHIKMVAGDRRYAFVRADDGSDWYVRKTDVRDFKKGDRVQFRTVHFEDDGRMFALDIERIGDCAHATVASQEDSGYGEEEN